MQSMEKWPSLDYQAINGTRDALHAYAQVLGNWLKSCRPKRKHWWHASLRPSLTGLDFELTLDLRDNQLYGRTADGASFAEALQGQPSAELEKSINGFLLAHGIDQRHMPIAGESNEDGFADYSLEQAVDIGRVLNSVTAVMAVLRAGIAEETSPIQLWPHHFDVSMLWLPGEKIPGQDPKDEEYSDKQMNIGFTFGDGGIPEPYFYITAYPLPDGFANLSLPAGSHWNTDGFSGAVLPYRSLIENSDPHAYLLDLWTGLLSAGRKLLLARTG
jgi:hypothetical protein